MAKAKIFQTNKDTLTGFFAQISLSEIRQACGGTIYERGKEYYESGCIREVTLETPQKLVAEVSGSDEYTVEIECKKPHITARCDCPYDYGIICKHIAAVLIHGQKQKDQLVPLHDEAPSEKTVSKQDLQKLSKQELIDLLLKQQSAKSPALPVIDDTQAEKLFQMIQKAVYGLFDDDRVMYEPDKFEKRLMQQLNKLRPAWHSNQADAIADFLLEFMQKVDAAFEEGYLYSENYYEGDDYFESDDFNDYVIDFAKTLPQETKFYFVKQVRKCIGEMSYSTFHDIDERFSEFFGTDDLPTLKEEFLQTLKKDKDTEVGKHYQTLLPVFSEQEKEFVLKKGYKQGSFLAMELFDFYTKQNQPAEALKYLHKYLKHHTDRDYMHPHYVNETVLKTYFEAAHSLDQPIYDVAEAAVASHLVNAEFFKTVAGYLPDRQDDLEKVFKKKNREEFFRYLSKQNRLPECLKMIRKEDVEEKTAFKFFAKHKKTVRDEAEAYFLHRIDGNLTKSDSTCYRNVVDTLLELKEIAPEATAEALRIIRLQYKRRISLMGMLNEHF
jgi:uncharacterized Zn finger protein